MQYRLRTLLILLAVLPPLIAIGWVKYQRRADLERGLAIEREWIAEQRRLRNNVAPGPYWQAPPPEAVFESVNPTLPYEELKD